MSRGGTWPEERRDADGVDENRIKQLAKTIGTEYKDDIDDICRLNYYKVRAQVVYCC